MASAQSSRYMRGGDDPQLQCHSERRCLSRQRPVHAHTHTHTFLNTGDQVHVFSRTAETWVDAEVVHLSDGQYVHLEYELASYRCGKMLPVQSDRLAIPRKQQLRHTASGQSDTSSASDFEECDPGTIFAHHSAEARSALGDFCITLANGVYGPVLDILDIEDNDEYEKHNSFSCRFCGEPLQGSITIEYNPKILGGLVDVVLKVYARPVEALDNKYAYYEVEPYFVHTLLHKPGEKVKFTPAFGAYFLGIVIHKDLSLDLQRKMGEDASHKEYIQGLIERFKNGWKENGEARGESRAEEADYLISYTGWNKRENDEMLKMLSTENVKGPHGLRPIRFCTDRSLGFGVHYHDFKHDESMASFGDLTALNLGKHGFAQPIASNGWWGEYEQAAKQTKHGILVLNASPQYFSSNACKKEWKHIPAEKRCVWLQEERRIALWQEIKHDEAVVGPLLGKQPLHDAANDMDKVKRLLQERANADSKTKNGKTPLMQAAGYGNLDVVKLLLNARALVNSACSSRGSTALMTAAAYGHHPEAPEIVKLLLKCRANAHTKDDEGRTALDYCVYGKDAREKSKKKMFGPRKKIHALLGGGAF